MASNVKITTSARNAIMDSIGDLADAGAGAAYLEVRTGAPPTSPSDASTGTLLATLTMSDPAFGTASLGQIIANPITPDSSAAASGEIGYVRLFDSDANCIIQCTAGDPEDNTDITFNEKTVIAGGTVEIDSYILPDPAPEDTEPPADNLYPLTVQGESWTFKTDPGSLTIRASHPRLLLTTDNLASKQSRIQNAAHLSLYTSAKDGSPAGQALAYQIDGDTTRGNLAKDALLALAADVEIDQNSGDRGFEWALVYDWTYDLMSPAERLTAGDRLMRICGMNPPDAGEIETGFSIQGNRHTDITDSMIWSGNDDHEPKNHSYGFLFRGVAALALAGDGYRDEWCDYVIARLQDGTDGRFYAMYDAERGAALDMHNLLALDSGGCRAGQHDRVISGYNGMFMEYGLYMQAAWDSAMDDNMLERNNMYRYMSRFVAYDRRRLNEKDRTGAEETIACCAGVYGDGLAQWLVDNHGQFTATGFPVQRLVLGDLDQAWSDPASEGLPETSYEKGACKWYSSTGWDDNSDTMLYVSSMEIDIGRHESQPGVFAVHRGLDKLIVAGKHKKGFQHFLWGSGLWMYPNGQLLTYPEFGTTYWGAQHLKSPSANWTSAPPIPGRMAYPYDGATKLGYRGPSYSELNTQSTYAVFGLDYGHWAVHNEDKRSLQVDKCKATFVHVKPDVNGREFLVIFYRTNTPAGVDHLWGCRTIHEASLSSNTFTVNEGTSKLFGTILNPSGTLETRGGIPQMTEGPFGEIYSGGTYTGYNFKNDDPSAIDTYGEYAVFFKPTSIQLVENYAVCLEIGATGFSEVTPTYGAGVVSVGGHTLDFSTEDSTVVTLAS